MGPIGNPRKPLRRRSAVTSSGPCTVSTTGRRSRVPILFSSEKVGLFEIEKGLRCGKIPCFGRAISCPAFPDRLLQNIYLISGFHSSECSLPALKICGREMGRALPNRLPCHLILSSRMSSSSGNLRFKSRQVIPLSGDGSQAFSSSRCRIGRRADSPAQHSAGVFP